MSTLLLPGCVDAPGAVKAFMNYERVCAGMQPAPPHLRFDPDVEWSVTDKIDVAFGQEYFGEDVVYVKSLPLAIHYICTGRVLSAIHLFFFGRPSMKLAEKFGYLMDDVAGASFTPTTRSGPHG